MVQREILEFETYPRDGFAVSTFTLVRWPLTLLGAGGYRILGPAYQDAAACLQTGEFANYGCARFATIVITASGAPASGIALRAALLDSLAVDQPNGLNSTLSDTRGRG